MEAGNLYGINETTTARRTKPTLSDHSVVFARWCHQHKNGRSRVRTCPVICGRLSDRNGLWTSSLQHANWQTRKVSSPNERQHFHSREVCDVTSVVGQLTCRRLNLLLLPYAGTALGKRVLIWKSK